jgi:hypothetical protein
MGRIEGRSLRRDLAQQKHTHTHRKMAINFPFVRAVVNLVVLLVFRRRLLFLFWNFISLFLLVSFLVRVVQIKTDAEALMRKSSKRKCQIV